MRNLTLSLILIFASLCATADEVADKWQVLRSKYFSLVQSGEYGQALKAASELSEIDPASTEAKLFLVFASVKSHNKIPGWVFREPWATSRAQDVFNRQLAEQLANGS